MIYFHFSSNSLPIELSEFLLRAENNFKIQNSRKCEQSIAHAGGGAIIAEMLDTTQVTKDEDCLKNFESPAIFREFTK